MRYSVLLYKYTANPDKVPGDWPAEVALIADDAVVEAPCQIMSIEDYATYISNPTLLAAKEQWNQQQAGNVVPTNLIITESIECSADASDPLLSVFSYTPGDSGQPDRVRVTENMPFKVTITVKDQQGTVVPVNDTFALPILGEGLPTQLLLVQFISGVASFELKFPQTGLYSITQETINRELPSDSQFAFSGVKIYVLRVP
jgi:hypothetical protein